MTDSAEHDAVQFAPGDQVIWVYERRGGWDYIEHIPVTVVRVGYKRVLIDAPLRDGGSRQVWVCPEHLRRKDSAP